MKVESKKIEGITASGTKGYRFESNIEIGMKVKTLDGEHSKTGVVGEEGIAGMLEVIYDDGSGSDLWMPHDLEIISANPE